MIRLNRQVVLGGLAVVMLVGTGCEARKLSAAPAPKQPRAGSPKPKTEPLPTGCRSRFAISKAVKAEGREGMTCDRKDRGAWQVVSSKANQQSPAQKQPDGKGGDGKKANGKVLDAKKGDYQPPPPAAGPEAPWQVAPGADPFCVFSWTGKEAPTAKELKLIDGELECAFAGVLAEAPAPAAVAEVPSKAPRAERASEIALAKGFERMARAIDPSATAAARRLIAKPRKRPRVAVVDATPFELDKPDTSGHGMAVSRVIGSLACQDIDSPECKAMIRPYMALGRVFDKSTETWVLNPNGGEFGTYHELHDAILLALKEKERDQNLIINLSLGWDPIMTDPNGPEIRHMTVLLERAACEGVLVIAAAGNLTGSEGPLLPAAFEPFRRKLKSPFSRERSPLPKEPSPLARCKELFPGVKAWPGIPTSTAARGYRPLIHAVGGVDIRDERLASSRPWGNPRLVAYGMSVTVPAPTPTGYTRPMTGTSMSAAIVSGIAAAVWSVSPKLDPSEVMARVYEGGRVLDGNSGNKLSRTEFCLDPGKDRCGRWQVRRASLCGALNKAGGGTTLKCIKHEPGEKVPDEVFPPDPPPAQGATTAARPLSPPCGKTNCGNPVYPMASQVANGVFPQPGFPSCPDCKIKLGPGPGIMSGTPAVAPANGDQLWNTLRLKTYVWPWGWVSQEYWVPAPLPEGVPISHEVEAPTYADQADILWTFNFHIWTITWETPVIIQYY